jgi:hypothetical protein
MDLLETLLHICIVAAIIIFAVVVDNNQSVGIALAGLITYGLFVWIFKTLVRNERDIERMDRIRY